MKCDVIVLYNLSTLDSKTELEENRKSLQRKYTERGIRCELVDSAAEIPALADAGSVGVYVLSHTKDVKPSVLASELFTGLFAKGAKVSKINIACCRGANDNLMSMVCSELVKCQNATNELPVGLLVCAFTVNVTTFEFGTPFTEEEGKKFSNYGDLSQQASRDERRVATVQQLWGTRDTNEPSFVRFLHDRMPSGATPGFIDEIKALFVTTMPEVWLKHRSTFISKQFNAQRKPKDKIAESDVARWGWSEFAKAHEKDAQNFIKNYGWDEFVRTVSSVTAKSAAMWTSLDGYLRMKKAMRFDGNAFKPAALSEYAGNRDMKQALQWVEEISKAKGRTLKFLPD